MRISASIVVYKNRPKQINSVLKSLAHSDVDIELLLIDNSPMQVNPDLDLLPGASYLKNRRNIGFGAAHNMALRKALDSGAKYHLVLNPDIFFSPAIIKELYNYMEENPDVGNIMPLVCYPDGQNQYLAKLLPTPGNLAVRLFHRILPKKMVDKTNTKYELKLLSLDKPVQVPSLSGCFMFLRCDALRRVGLFDERFFLYFEDFDLIRRINTFYKVIYYPRASIKHQFERASRKNIFAFASHLASAVKYFNKWGWFKDEHRDLSNAGVIAHIIRNRQEKDRHQKCGKSSLTKRNIRSIALISNQSFAMINFRGRLISDLVARGVRVYALAPDYNDKFRDKTINLGAIPVDFFLDRTGVNPAADCLNMFKLSLILAKLKPDAVLSNFIKPVIYGSWAARRAGIRNIFSMISGLGYMYTQSPSRQTLKRPLFREAVSLLYKSALAFNVKVFFHNPDDQAWFVSQGLIEMDKSVRIFGSGVDLKYFAASEVDRNRPFSFLLVARLLIEKGIREYFQAAKIVKNSYPDVSFVILGGKDINPAGLKEDEVKKWVEAGIIEWPGQVDDVRSWLKNCGAYVLPSWREGTPRSTLEAMAMGRAVITTDVPGCRETVFSETDDNFLFRQIQESSEIIYGKNGLMVPVRDPQALAKAMQYLIENQETAFEMGRQSRHMAEKYYDVKKVNEVILREIGLWD